MFSLFDGGSGRVSSESLVHSHVQEIWADWEYEQESGGRCARPDVAITRLGENTSEDRAEGEKTSTAALQFTSHQVRWSHGYNGGGLESLNRSSHRFDLQIPLFTKRVRR